VSAPILEFRNVAYRLNRREILSAVNLSVRAGEVLALLGESGAGKTTVLRLANRLLVESAGEVVIQDRPARAWDVIELRRQMGYVVQDTGLFPHYSVARNVNLLPDLLGQSKQQMAARTDEMLHLVGLEPGDFRHRYPHELSGGQRQRVGVARALAGDPPILLMDEPFGALDPLTRVELQQEFKKLQARLQKAVVLVTHDLREALFLGTSVCLMDAGKIVTICSPQEFLRSRDNRVQAYVQAFRANDPFAEEARSH
jgi:osmoprotectant transport system ATP-binding protein